MSSSVSSTDARSESVNRVPSLLRNHAWVVAPKIPRNGDVVRAGIETCVIAVAYGGQNKCVFKHRLEPCHQRLQRYQLLQQNETHHSNWKSTWAVWYLVDHLASKGFLDILSGFFYIGLIPLGLRPHFAWFFIVTFMVFMVFFLAHNHLFSSQIAFCYFNPMAFLSPIPRTIHTHRPETMTGDAVQIEHLEIKA